MAGDDKLQKPWVVAEAVAVNERRCSGELGGLWADVSHSQADWSQFVIRMRRLAWLSGQVGWLQRKLAGRAARQMAVQCSDSGLSIG